MKISADRFSGYSPVGDILVTAVCIVLLILMLFSYIKRNRAFKIFAAILCTLVLAAYTDIGYQTMMIGYKPSLTVPLIIMRLGMHFSIFTMLLLFVV